MDEKRDQPRSSPVHAVEEESPSLPTDLSQKTRMRAVGGAEAPRWLVASLPTDVAHALERTPERLWVPASAAGCEVRGSGDAEHTLSFSSASQTQIGPSSLFRNCGDTTSSAVDMLTTVAPFVTANFGALEENVGAGRRAGVGRRIDACASTKGRA
eukprot:scaffold132316_cov27-Tisochrysis_lutea.AAC.4